MEKHNYFRTKILASTPSSGASTSIVALSVSISNKTSPALITSPGLSNNQNSAKLTVNLIPSCFNQRTIEPSVIVGDRAGKLMGMPASEESRR